MSKQKLKFWLIGAVALMVVGIAMAMAAFSGTGTPEPASGVVEIVTAGGQSHRFNIEIAATPAQQETGLMYRREIADNYGMVFLNPEPRPIQMWMRNTYIPLDMLFIGANGVIRHIHPQAQPFDETPIPSRFPVKATLEIKGGLAAKLGIRAGDKVKFPAFSN